MAVSATLIHATDHALVYAISHDGAAGDDETIDNATLQADAAGKPALLEMLATAVANQPEAIILLAGRAPGVCRITPAAEALWYLNIVENGGLAEIEVHGQAGTANEGILEVVREHSVSV